MRDDRDVVGSIIHVTIEVGLKDSNAIKIIPRNYRREPQTPIWRFVGQLQYFIKCKIDIDRFFYVGGYLQIDVKYRELYANYPYKNY